MTRADITERGRRVIRLEREALSNIAADPLKYALNVAANGSRMFFNSPYSFERQSPKALVYALPNSLVLGAMTTAVPQATLTNVFSVDSFYRYAAVMVACQNTDSYLSSGKDHYLYIDDVHGDGSTFPFDLNADNINIVARRPVEGGPRRFILILLADPPADEARQPVARHAAQRRQRLGLGACRLLRLDRRAVQQSEAEQDRGDRGQ